MLRSFAVHSLAEVGAESGSQLTLAENAIVIAEPKQGKLELHLQGGSTHEFDRAEPDHYSVTAFGWPVEKREELRQSVLQEYGERLELIAPE